MYKKFVPLTSDQSPSENPYEIRTFQGESLKPVKPEWQSNEVCGYIRDCNTPPPPPQNSTLAQVLTLQNEIRKLNQRTQENIFLKPFCKKCQIQDRFTTCVVPQRTPEQLKHHAKLCEECLKIKQQMAERVYDVSDVYSKHEGLVKLKDPLEISEDKEEVEETAPSQDGESIKPEIASPECSREYIYVPPKDVENMEGILNCRILGGYYVFRFESEVLKKAFLLWNFKNIQYKSVI